MQPDIVISSLQNDRVKQVVKLRDRPQRDKLGLLLVEGYRENRRALDNGHRPVSFFYCPALFQGENEPDLLQQARAAGAELAECSETVFRKMAYRDRPDGLLSLAPQIHRTLGELTLPDNPLLLVMERIEKPGNLGTMLRTADAGGVHAVIVCDKCTDVNNPNVVRASVGTLFTVPLAEADSDEAIAWLRARGIRILAATPAATADYCDVDLAGPCALVMGSEQFGLTSVWMEQADLKVRIPMLGQADSLNVSAAATILVYEAVRQRRALRR